MSFAWFGTLSKYSHIGEDAVSSEVSENIDQLWKLGHFKMYFLNTIS